MAIRAIRGVHDILPSEGARWQRLEGTARRTFEAYGYREIRLPVFERTELFARGIGEVTDIVQKEMYTFADRSGESLTLRPEATASLLRAYIEHGLHVWPKPVRLYTMGPMFRYERPQAGRYRQFHQADVEAIGESHPALDAEVIAMLLELFRRLGLASRLELRLNSIGDSACRPQYRAELQAYLREHRAGLCEECRERTEKNPLRVLDCKKPRCQPLIDQAPSILEALCRDCAEHFTRVRSYLDALGLPYVVIPRLVRGFDYYVRTTFELVTKGTRLPGEAVGGRGLGAQNAVGGGGRYDGLVQLLDGPAEPAIGFAIGMERVVLLLDDARDENAPLALLVPLGPDALGKLLPMVQAVRARGIPVELGYGDKKLRAELDRANRLKLPYAVIVGAQELGAGAAILREMATGTQRTVPLEQLVEELVSLGGRS
ncbi:MAG: histidine--tRNA ligase [Candidatus Rokubacteria bacterium]|nr:histidine--tRNA ligase [Candidatus Rokubacteria bacterium]